ncbi:hypothetical protein HID58_029335 [Brassica napus]|uniref:Uncharacterized protein n=1 Tax=Brassica napus TaxID=3708 RepID=A0ABQ8CCT4_BRANA|nr:hypothetical protein HID58_029335 [Brassica napus]
MTDDHHVSDCPAINEHASRHPSTPFLRCQTRSTTELRHQRSQSGEETVQTELLSPAIEPKPNLTDQHFGKDNQLTTIRPQPSIFLYVKRSSLMIKREPEDETTLKQG